MLIIIYDTHNVYIYIYSTPPPFLCLLFISFHQPKHCYYLKIFSYACPWGLCPRPGRAALYHRVQRPKMSPLQHLPVVDEGDAAYERQGCWSHCAHHRRCWRRWLLDLSVVDKPDATAPKKIQLINKETLKIMAKEISGRMHMKCNNRHLMNEEFVMNISRHERLWTKQTRLLSEAAILPRHFVMKDVATGFKLEFCGETMEQDEFTHKHILAYKHTYVPTYIDH